jgi:hypothetical protein
MARQEYIDAEVERHHNHSRKVSMLPREERRLNAQDLRESMEDIEHYVFQCRMLLHMNYGFGVGFLFWRFVEQCPRGNHVAYLAYYVAECAFNVDQVTARRVFNNLPHETRKEIADRMRVEIAEAKAAREQS